MSATPDLSSANPSRDLTELEIRILDFEDQDWILRPAGAKLQAIYDEFRIGWVRYHQILNRLIRTPEGIALKPAMARRLTEATERRMAQRHRPLDVR